MVICNDKYKLWPVVFWRAIAIKLNLYFIEDALFSKMSSVTFNYDLNIIIFVVLSYVSWIIYYFNKIFCLYIDVLDEIITGIVTYDEFLL